MEVLNAPPPREVRAEERPSARVEAAILLLLIAIVALAGISALGGVGIRLSGRVRDSIGTALQATTVSNPAYEPN